MSEYIPIATVAELAGLSRQAAHKVAKRALDGKPWRGASLIVHQVRGIGGRSGLSYQVRVDSLPLALQLRWKDSQGAFEGPLQHSPAAQAERDLWDNSLSPIAAHPPHSNARGDAVRHLVANPPLGPDGKPLQLSERTVFRKLATYEKGGGFGHLSRHKRRDAGTRKVALSREFDAAAMAAGITDERLEEFAHDLRQHIRSLIAKGLSRKLIALVAQTHLNDRARALNLPTPERPFGIPANLIQAERDFRRVAIFNRDRKAYEDARPRITRTREGLSPMAIIVADVHPLDIIVKREDGSLATGRMIGWLDIATNRLWADIVLLEKGEGVRNSHVIQSFVSMVAAWGAPRILYLDNGSEYNWAEFIDDALKLLDRQNQPLIGKIGKWQDRRSNLIRAQAYNASSKPIEGVFGILERTYFSHIPGWIGGDRLMKKTANVGRAPVPFPGPFDELKVRLSAAVALYNTMPQRGMKGCSPDDRYRSFIETGWAMTAVGENALRIAFSTEKVRPVRQGFVHLSGEKWTCRELQAYQGKMVTALVPKYENWDRLPLKNERGELFAYAERETAYGYLDKAGATEAGKRAGAHRRGVLALQKSVPDIDVPAELDAAILHFPKPAIAPVSATLGPSDGAKLMLANIDEPAHERKLRAWRKRGEEHERWERLMQERRNLEDGNT